MDSQCQLLGDKEGWVVLNRQFQRGVSLVEVMIALIVAGVLLGSGVPAYRSWIQNSQVRTAAESVQNGLQLARSTATQNNTNVEFSVAANNWQVNILQTGAVGSVFYTAASAVQARSAVEGTKNATITTQTVSFDGRGRLNSNATVTYAIHSTAGACATTTNRNDIRCLNVQVTPGGKVRICDDMLNGTGNPQACTP